MNIVFMGTAPFAVPALNALTEQPDMDVRLVVTQPDRPSGRGRSVKPTPCKARAEELGLPVFQPDDVRSDEAFETIRALAPDYIVVVAYGQILDERILSMPKKGCINLHGSLLPAYRGAAPVHWAVIQGETRTGVCTMHMARRLDAGDVIYCEETPIDPQEQTGSLYARLAALGAHLLVRTLRDLQRGCAPRIVQDDSAATYAPQIHRSERYLDWHDTAQDIANKVRGLMPVPRALARMDGEDWIITSARVAQGTDVEGLDPAALPGTVGLASAKRGLFVRAGGGWIEILKLKTPGKREMDAKAYLNGAAIQAGARFEEGTT